MVEPTGGAALDQPFTVSAAQFSGDQNEYPLALLPFPHPNLGDGSGANNPWLQETPDPMTTVMWSSWVEINPQTAAELGVKDDDLVMISSPAGQVEAVVYEFPAIHPGMIAIPFGQGHTAMGRYANGRGINPLDLLDPVQNEAGNLAFGATRVKVQPTGKRRPLARYESRVGIYGEKGKAQA
jgi:anaerobic selenocysteine-containing dehydrogenase